MDPSEQGTLTLGDILRELKPTPSAYLKAARQIETMTREELMPVNIAILSTFTSEILRPYIVVESAARGMLARLYFAPFNQIEQQVLNPASALYEFGPDVVVIATRLEEIAPALTARFLTLSSADVEAEVEGVEARLRNLIRGLRRSTAGALLVFNYTRPAFLAADLADASLEVSQISAVEKANVRVAEVCRTSSGAHVFNYARLVSEFGLRRWYDPRLLYLGRIPFGAEAQLETGRWLARHLRALFFSPCKCLVVDLDNTLWGGVLGEDGPGGIALGEEFPGNVYKDFQRILLSLRDRGILLAVASKNNEPDVRDVFQKHPDCVMNIEDFAALQIGWQDKATSLAAIARDLNIGTDALAFFDENPVEREWVRSQMPEVAVIEVPDSPLGFTRALYESGVFDHLTVSLEDRTRTEFYRQDAERKQLLTRSVTLEEFLQGLEMVATVGYVNAGTLPRAAQLLAKTNQFNLTTRRHTAPELQAMIDSGAVALWLRVGDRLGDNGLVGLAIAVPREASQWAIDSFLLSCRVIGRRVETVLLGMLSRVIRERGGRILLGEYIPAPKNGVASAFYAAHGFEPIDGDGRFWRWILSRGEIPLPEFVRVISNDDAGS